MRIWNDQKFIICDLDGTLFLDPSGQHRYERDFENDIVIPQTWDLLKRYPKHGMLFITGRKEKFHYPTDKALWKIGFDIEFNSSVKLFMRSNHDDRSDEIVKKEIYQKNIAGRYEIDFVLENRPRVVRMWRDLGLFVFEVNQLNKEF